MRKTKSPIPKKPSITITTQKKRNQGDKQISINKCANGHDYLKQPFFYFDLRLVQAEHSRLM